LVGPDRRLLFPAPQATGSPQVVERGFVKSLSLAAVEQAFMLLLTAFIALVVRVLTSNPKLLLPLKDHLPGSVDGAAPRAITIRGFAARWAYSERTIEYLLTRGLPSVGQKRMRRIPLPEADEWMKRHLNDEDDALDRAVDEDMSRRRGR
jgi:hypothetical protein